jgi:crossover junction endodeoxyribonuclease RusA
MAAAEPSVKISGLPFPPSVNHYWRHVGSRTLISRTGRAYRQQVLHDVEQLGLRAITGPIRLEVIVTRPDRRRRDLDNLLKSLLDALDHAGVYEDDSQIQDLRISWKWSWQNQQPVIVAGGLCEVRIWRI